MESSIFTLLLLAASSTAILACDQNRAMGECMGHMGAISGALSGGSAPTQDQLKMLCKTLDEFTTCITESMAGCSAEISSKIDQLTAQMTQFRSMCASMGAGGTGGGGPSGGSGAGCDQMRIQGECMGHMTKIGSMAQSVESQGANVDPAAVQEMCGYLQEFAECIEQSIAGCPPEVKSQLSSMTAQMDQFKSMCSTDSECSLMSIQSCFQGFPQSQAQAESMNQRELCKIVAKGIVCGQDLKTKCTAQPLKEILEKAITGVEEADTQCKNTYGEGYASDMSDTQGPVEGGPAKEEKMEGENENGSKGSVVVEVDVKKINEPEEEGNEMSSGSGSGTDRSGNTGDGGNGAETVLGFSLVTLIISVMAAKLFA